MYISLDIKNETIAKKILDYLASFTKEDLIVKTTKNDNKWEDENITSIHSYNDRIKKSGAFSDDIRSF